jgi:signal peptidase
MQTAPEDRENSNAALATSVLRQGGTIALKAWGTSMLPALWPGDVLTIVGALSTEIVPGDIVLVLRNDRIFAHRLLGRHKDASLRAWITKGDAMSDNDPPAPESALLGRVVSIRRYGRDLTPGRQISRLQSLIASLASESDRFRSLLLRLHAREEPAPPQDSFDSFAARLRRTRSDSNDCGGRESSP